MSDPKYINVMDLRREIRALPDYGELWRKAMKRFLDCIDEVPAADVVQVLRCKDCKHWDSDALCCSRENHYIVNAEADNYCSYGVRRDG